MANSNDLNLLLKAKVVKLKVELDAKGSRLPSQVNAISKMLENNPVKLKVELKATLGNLRKQVSLIQASINTASIKPIKLKAEIDMVGSTRAIKSQLKDINRMMDEFGDRYSSKMKKVQDDASKSVKSPINAISSGEVNKNINQAKNYASTLKEAETHMRNMFGKGFFGSTEIKNAQGHLMGFTASLTKANGVVQSIKYQWDDSKGNFMPINQRTVTATEKHTKQAIDALRGLDREVMKLGDSQGRYWDELNKLFREGSNGNLNKDAVADLRRRIKDEQALEQAIRNESQALREQKAIISEIKRSQKELTSSKLRTEASGLRSRASLVDVSDSNASKDLAEISRRYKEIQKEQENVRRKEKQIVDVSEKRAELLHRINQLEKSTYISSSAGAGSKRYIDETRAMTQTIKTMEDYEKVQRRMNSTNRALASAKLDSDVEKGLGKLEIAMMNFADKTGKSSRTIQTRFEQVKDSVKGNLGLIQSEIEKFNRLASKHSIENKLNNKNNSIVDFGGGAKGKEQLSNFRTAVTNKDTNEVKKYISELNNAEVAMLNVSRASNGITRIRAQFASAGKTAREVTYELDNVSKKLRQVGDSEVFNANRNLGVFEQLKIAMARVPVWMMATTAFYAPIRGIQAVTTEILELDKAMTELRRVADAGIDVEHVFQGAVQLSKELGNNIHDVMQSVNDLARTFGHFNERQLLAIANTATLMSNVSDLTAQEATESLVGTMNAFNITAEESIRIVDALNEVNNISLPL